MSSFADLASAAAAAARSDNENPEMMSITLQTVSGTDSGPGPADLGDLRDNSGDTLGTLTSIFDDQQDESQLCKAARALQMTWHILVQLLTIPVIQALNNTKTITHSTYRGQLINCT